MKSAPFLAQPPKKYLADAEEKDFWDYLIRFLGTLQSDGQRTDQELSDSINLDEMFSSRSVETAENQSTLSFEAPQDAQNSVFTARSATSDTEAIDREFISASNAITVRLDDAPPSNAIIKIRNADGSEITVNGNGKNINGATTATFTQQNTVYDFYYLIDTDEWAIA